ncbi:MAG: cobyrinate a,c-diamide synthase [Magnetococcales bacterium]|nr:cobyrinate a,c-diamide synthase [Magnetococcales bacterium]
METAPGFLIAGAHSRSGKTTVALAVMAALKAAGQTVAPFKAGPDFIDPQWHAALCGTPSYSLDTFMAGESECRALLARHAPPGAVAVVEGVMGLYDGKSGVGGPGSTADLARCLGLPVLLVVDAKGMAGSIAPLVSGFVGFARGFEILGVIANRVGSTRHAEILAQALGEFNLPPLLGWMRQDPAVALGERHLGLILPEDQPAPPWANLTAALTLDLDRLLERLPRPAAAEAPSPSPPLLRGRIIGVARDAAFCFLYPANLAWLEAMGAEARFFSPLAGEPPPSDANALWLPGGYPELHAAALSRSPTWEGVRRMAEGGTPILAECGGMMALGEFLTDHGGASWPMAGVLPIHTRMTGKLAGLGYRQEAGGARGHEFHHSVRDPSPLPPAFQLDRGDGGVRRNNVRASYVHWYFPSQPEQCARWLGADEYGVC